ncbi:MAG: hypothetical protein AAAB35_11685 [Phyllobacterium sp.]|uniref:hypothetical protein n=1 Tax=Phyllobacterium sp. TaxID=1871046 RepID=UPI0030EFF9A3
MAKSKSERERAMANSLRRNVARREFQQALRSGHEVMKNTQEIDDLLDELETAESTQIISKSID